MEKQIIKPKVSPSFFYGSILSYNFRGSGISKNKNKYRIRFTLVFQSGDAINSQIGGFLTLQEATQAKDHLISELVNRTYIPFQYTFSEFCDYWLYYYKIDTVKIRYTTFENYRNLLYNHLIPAIGYKKILNEITVKDLEKVIRNIQSPSIQQTARKRIKDIFVFAAKEHFIKFNPALATYENTKNIVKSKENRNIIPYSVEQIKLLLYTCRENFTDMYMPLLLSVYVGTRISETIALCCSDVDFTAGAVYISKQIRHKIVAVEPKDDFDDVKLMELHIIVLILENNFIHYSLCVVCQIFIGMT